MIRQRLLKDQILSDRERKNIAILELIGKSGPLTKTDISKITELNIVTVSNYINNYIKAGLIEEKGFDVSSGGRKPALVDLNYNSGYVVGIGVSPQFNEIVCVLIDYGSHLVKKKSLIWDSSNRSGALIEEMANLLDQVIAESGVEVDKIKGIGAALPGVLDERGNTVKWPSSVGEMNISMCLPVRSVLERRFRMPIFIERSDIVAVSGERWMNLSSDVQNVLFMYSGVGCGYIICGQLFRGTGGTAGSLGIDFEDQTKISDLRQDYFDLGICDDVYLRLKNGEESTLYNGEHPKLEAIILAAQNGDRVCVEVIQDAGVRLGQKVAFLVNLLNPEVVVIGGGIEDAGPIFLDSVRKSVKKHAVEEVSNVLKVIPSTLGDELLALGAASVVIQELFAQV